MKWLHPFIHAFLTTFNLSMYFILDSEASLVAAAFTSMTFFISLAISVDSK
jgi:hypothetical protein